MEEGKIERIREEAEKVLERYANSITRKAFIQFAENVMEIVAEDKEH